MKHKYRYTLIIFIMLLFEKIYEQTQYLIYYYHVPINTIINYIRICKEEYYGGDVDNIY